MRNTKNISNIVCDCRVITSLLLARNVFKGDIEGVKVS